MIRPWKVQDWLGHQRSSAWTWTQQNMSKVWSAAVTIFCSIVKSQLGIWFHIPEGTLNLPTYPNFQLRNLAALTLWTPRTTTSRCKRWVLLSEWWWSSVQCMRWTFVVSDVLCLLLLQVLIEMTNGGVDRSVECTGNVNAMISAFECVHDVCS
jgi:hypothetical protein